MASAVDIANLALARVGGLQPVSDLANDTSTNGKLVALLYPQIRNALLEQFPWAFATKNVLLFDSTTATAPQVAVPGWAYAYGALPADFVRALRVFNGARAGQPMVPAVGMAPHYAPPMFGWSASEVPFEVLGGASDGLLFTDYEEAIPAWSSTTTYQQPAVVSQNGQAYLALQSSTNIQPPSLGIWQGVSYQRQVQLLYTGLPDNDWTDTTPLFRGALSWKLAVEIALSRPDPEVAARIELRAEQALMRAMAADLNARGPDAHPVSRTISARG